MGIRSRNWIIPSQSQNSRYSSCRWSLPRTGIQHDCPIYVERNGSKLGYQNRFPIRGSLGTCRARFILYYPRYFQVSPLSLCCMMHTDETGGHQLNLMRCLERRSGLGGLGSMLQMPRRRSRRRSSERERLILRGFRISVNSSALGLGGRVITYWRSSVGSV